MAYVGTHKGEEVAAFAAAVERIQGYQVPDSPDRVRELTCAVPDHRGNHPSRVRFFLRQAGVVFDLHRPGSDVTDDSGLVIQINQPHNAEDFPGANVELDRVFDSQLYLTQRGRPRLLMARTELFNAAHEELLARAGLGELVVANFTSTYGFNAPYGSSVDAAAIRGGIMELPERLEALATELR